jgi:hypothetical protein
MLVFWNLKSLFIGNWNLFVILNLGFYRFGALKLVACILGFKQKEVMKTLSKMFTRTIKGGNQPSNCEGGDS